MKNIEGLYRIKRPHITYEKHGGMTLKQEVFWYLAFYKSNTMVGLYGSSKEDYDDFFTKNFELKGSYNCIDYKVAFKIINPYTNESIDFKGIISENKKEIQIQGTKESDSEHKWIDDTFQKIEIDNQSNGQTV